MTDKNFPLEFVDETGMDIPEEFREQFHEALVQAGVVIAKPDGTFEINPDCIGKLVGIDVSLDDDGELEEARRLTEEELDEDLNRQ